MRTTDKKRFIELGDQLRQARLEVEPPDIQLNTHELAEKLDRPQPWVSEVENGERYPDVFDFVRWCRALGMEDDLAYDLLKDIVDNPSLDEKVKPKAPKSRPKPGAKRKRKIRKRP